MEVEVALIIIFALLLPGFVAKIGEIKIGFTGKHRNSYVCVLRWYRFRLVCALRRMFPDRGITLNSVYAMEKEKPSPRGVTTRIFVCTRCEWNTGKHQIAGVPCISEFSVLH